MGLSQSARPAVEAGQEGQADTRGVTDRQRNLLEPLVSGDDETTAALTGEEFRDVRAVADAVAALTFTELVGVDALAPLLPPQVVE